MLLFVRLYVLTYTLQIKNVRSLAMHTLLTSKIVSSLQTQILTETS